MTFKVGDKVKVITDIGGYLGATGVIRVCNLNNFYPIHVVFDDKALPTDGSHGCLFSPDELERINMAKLICKDGTEVNISAETEAELRVAFGKKDRYMRIGDYFKSWGDLYILHEYSNGVRGVNLRTGTFCYSVVKVGCCSKITEDEMRKIVGSNNWEKVDKDYVKRNL